MLSPLPQPALEQCPACGRRLNYVGLSEPVITGCTRCGRKLWQVPTDAGNWYFDLSSLSAATLPSALMPGASMRIGEETLQNQTAVVAPRRRRAGHALVAIVVYGRPVLIEVALTSLRWKPGS